MIVYSTARCWFTEKATAETYRKSLGLKPSATLKVEINGRDDLALLLNMLCSPPIKGAAIVPPATLALVETAYVAPTLDIADVVPRFLLKEHEEREARMAKLRVNKEGY